MCPKKSLKVLIKPKKKMHQYIDLLKNLENSSLFPFCTKASVQHEKYNIKHEKYLHPFLGAILGLFSFKNSKTNFFPRKSLS